MHSLLSMKTQEAVSTAMVSHFLFKIVGMVWYGIYFPYKSTIHNINMSFKKTAGFALLSKHLQSIAVFQRGPVQKANAIIISYVQTVPNHHC